eukprot:gene11623-biopygen9292
MEGLEKLKKIRRSHRTVATKLVNKVNDALARNEDNEEWIDPKVSKQYKMQLSEKKIDLKNCDRGILDSMPEEANDDALDQEIEDASDYREKITQAIIAVDEILEGLKSSELLHLLRPSRSSSKKSLVSTISSRSAQSERKIKVNLPKLELKKFEGKIYEWQEFWDGERNVTKLRLLYDKVETHFRGLEAQEVDQTSYSSIVVPVILDKIPENVQYNMIRSSSADHLEWNMKEILTALERELVVRESHTSPFKSSQEPEVSKREDGYGLSENKDLKAKAVDRLGLRPTRRESLSVRAFGSDETDVKMRDVVKKALAPLGQGKSINVECFVVDDISCIANEHLEVVKNDFSHLNKIWFSDVSRNEEDVLTVDVLIGADELWSFQDGEITRGGPYEPVAVKASLGWMLSGPLKGASNRKEAFDLYLKAKGRMKERGFRLRKWKTSDVELSQKIKESEGMNERPTGQTCGEEMSYAKKMLGVEKASDSKTKVLGVIWNNCKDNLEFKLSKRNNRLTEVAKS